MNGYFFHGTSNKNAANILEDRAFNPGNDEFNEDFLGEGVYFWEEKLEAVDWNIRNYKKENRGKIKISDVIIYYSVLKAHIVAEDSSILDLDTRMCKLIFDNLREEIEETIIKDGRFEVDFDSLTDATIINYLTIRKKIDNILVIKKRYPISVGERREKSRLNQIYRAMICVKNKSVISDIEKVEITREDLKTMNIN